MPGQHKRPFQFSLTTAFVLLSVAAVGCTVLSTLITDPELIGFAVAMLLFGGLGLLNALLLFGHPLAAFISLLARLLVAARPRLRKLLSRAR